MKFGICCAPSQFTAQAGEKLTGAAKMFEVLEAAGAEYVEWGVSQVEPDSDGTACDTLREALTTASLGAEVFNSFVPGRLPITGPEVDLGAVLAYANTAMQRCASLGAKVIVLGSGAARRVPEGFDELTARQQFVQFCRELAPTAQAMDLVIALEPLNRNEDNFLNSVTDGCVLVDEIACPSIQLLADLYHMETDGEAPAAVIPAGGRLHHVHVADSGRVAPGYAQGCEADFLGFFAALRRAGYGGNDQRCSFEGSFSDIATQCGPVLKHLRTRWQESSAVS
jgi:sugar phosphate isomerase/epimerase